jgi:hypothetical protein
MGEEKKVRGVAVKIQRLTKENEELKWTLRKLNTSLKQKFERFHKGLINENKSLTKENEGLKTALKGVTLKAITDIAGLVRVRDELKAETFVMANKMVKLKADNHKLTCLNRECAESNDGYNKSINEIAAMNLKLDAEKEELNRRRDADTRQIIRMTGEIDGLRKQIEGISSQEAVDIADRESYHLARFITDLETGIKKLSAACETEEERMGYNDAIRDVLTLITVIRS